MTDLMLLLGGMLIVIVTVADALWTTLTVSGAGWLSTRIAGGIGRFAMKGPSWLAENASIAAICGSFAIWFVFLWLGWALLFCSSESAVVDATTSQPADPVDRVYFVGFTLTTLGIGDFKPGGDAWRILTVLAAATGFVLVTLSMTYVLSILTALNRRRALGAAVGHLGSTPEEIVCLAKDGRSELSERLMSLTGELEKAAMQTDAFPVLEYSHVAGHERSFARAVIVLGEVSLLFQHAIDEQAAVPRVVWSPLQRAVQLLIQEKSAPEVDKDAPPLPDLSRLETSGLPLAADAAESFQRADVSEDRARWRQWLHRHHRSWSEIK